MDNCTPYTRLSISVRDSLPYASRPCAGDSTEADGETPEKAVAGKSAAARLPLTQAIEGGLYLDMVIYDDSPGGRVDSWQSMPLAEGLLPQGLSCRNGDKIMLARVSGGRGSSWNPGGSLESARAMEISLADEEMDAPGMYAECAFKTGGTAALELRPSLAAVRLESLCADFFGKSYENAVLKNVKVYLTNVHGTCRPFDRSFSGGEILNCGALSESDLSRMKDPSMLAGSYDKPVGIRYCGMDMTFFCYPDRALVEGPGERFTRLVIEAEVDGCTWYWPINVNREDFGVVNGHPGIESNIVYNYVVKITSLGSTDPDTPVTPSQVRVAFGIEEWDDSEEIMERY
ncbi:MAG: hypothetical protein HUJ94_03500 [Bacteroidales bacterium]|nr:hypothetical protein [Bacteroidales bacterium]